MVLIFILAVLALCIFSTPLTERLFGAKAGLFYSGVFAGLLGVFLTNSSNVINQSKELSYSISWISNLDVNFSFRLDGLGIVFASLVLGIGALVFAYSAFYLPKKQNTSFYALMITFAFAMTGLVFSNDLVLLLIFWEFTTICSFFLIARSGASGYLPSLRTLLLTTIGGLSFLAATVLTISETSTSNIREILNHNVWTENTGFTATIAVLVTVAAFTKSAQFPFHAWLPDAMAAIMPVSAYLHAAAMVKAGIFLLMRFSPIFADTFTWNFLLIILGSVTMLIGSVFALQRNDIKELLAYSTVSQLGLIVLVIGIGSTYALTAAAVHVIAHALFKASLFMSAGVIDKQAGSRNLNEIHGIGRKKPLTGLTIALSSLSMAGILPLFGFVSKEFIIESALGANNLGWLQIVALASVIVGSIFTFAYSGKIIVSVFRPDDDLKIVKDAKWLIAAPLVAAIFGVVFGLFAFILDPVIKVSTLASLNIDFEPHLKLWHGFNTALFISLVIVTLGSILVYKSTAISKIIDRKLFPSSGVQVVESIRNSFLALGVRVRNITSADSPPRHLAIPFGILITYALVMIISRPQTLPLIEDSDRASDWFLFVLLVVPVLGILKAKSRISAVILLGGIGLIMMLYFFSLGAPDVGITQLLVELLTVIFMMFSLRRLPKTFHRVKKSRVVLSSVTAIIFGSLAALTTYYFSGRREFSNVSNYYLENAESETGGTNVVNTILVDFRALDTMVELTVLATAGISIMALLIAARVLQKERRIHSTQIRTAADSFSDNHIPIRVFSKVLIPFALVISSYIMLRGHHEPGGGFIAALFTCVAIALVYLGTSHRNFIQAKWLPYLFIGNGMLIAISSGFIGYIDGAFLRPIKIRIDFWFIDYAFTSALIFDLGVFLAVVGVVLAAINRLSMDAPHDQLTIAPHSEVEEMPGPIAPSEVIP